MQPQTWLTPRSRIFYSRKFNFWGRGLFTSRACDACALKDALLAYFKKSNPSKAVLLVLPAPLSLQMPSFCIGLARPRQINAWQKSRKEQATQRPSRPQKSTKRGTYEKYTPKEKAKTSCYARYHSHNKASPSLAKRCSDHEIFNTKINNFANFECFTKFLCLENLELYGMLSTCSLWHAATPELPFVSM